VLYGILLCSQGAIERGYRFGKLALTLLDQLKAHSLRAGVTHLFLLFIQHWKDSIHKGLQQSLAMYRLGLETGDFLYGAYSAHVYCAYALCSGRELTDLAETTESYNSTFLDLRQDAALRLNQMVQQACLNLLGQVDHPCVLAGTAFDETAELEPLQQANHSTAVFLILIFRLMLAYLVEVEPN
jgi:predicted ATPase